MARADAMSRIGRPEYWRAYKRGLQRAHYGKTVVGQDEHAAFLALARSENPAQAERGRGYMDGMTSCSNDSV